MNLNTLLDLAIMIFAGMFCGRMAKHVHLPNVTGYLVAGLLIGPSVFGLLSEDFLTTINIISDVALGFIAFSIGNEFKMSYFKRVGVAPIVIACLESLFAVVFVVLGLLIARQPLPFSLVLGAIAAATAPAATIMVIKQYRAKGPVTETLLSVVAIDDATALILFSLAVAVAQGLTDAGASFGASLLSPLREIGGAIVVGAALGFISCCRCASSRRLATACHLSLRSCLRASASLPCLICHPCCCAWPWARSWRTSLRMSRRSWTSATV